MTVTLKQSKSLGSDQKSYIYTQDQVDCSIQTENGGKTHMVNVARYKNLVADLRYDGYTVRFCAIEVTTRGIVSKSTYGALKQGRMKETT